MELRIQNGNRRFPADDCTKSTPIFGVNYSVMVGAKNDRNLCSSPTLIYWAETGELWGETCEIYRDCGISGAQFDIGHTTSEIRVLNNCYMFAAIECGPDPWVFRKFIQSQEQSDGVLTSVLIQGLGLLGAPAFSLVGPGNLRGTRKNL